MKTVVLDAYTTNPGDLSWSWLKEFGEYEAYDFTKPEEILERAAGCEIVLTNKTVLTADILSQLKGLRYIGLLSTGFNAVDIEYAAGLGIPVTNIPSYSTAAVAQMTFALILELCNQAGLHSKAVHDGEWSAGRDFCFWKTPLIELFEKTIGIVGFGRIGRKVAGIALAHDMRVLVCTPEKTGTGQSGDFRQTGLDELLEKADIVTMHCPLTPETERMANAAFFEKMKDSAFFINTSRGGVVDEPALANALNAGIIAGAGVDVLSTEPPKPDNPLLHCKNCFITPHIAWAGYETRKRLVGICRDNIKAYMDGKYLNVVNGVNGSTKPGLKSV